MNVEKLRRLIVEHRMRAAQLRSMSDELREMRDDIRRATVGVWTSGRDDAAIYGRDMAELIAMPQAEVDRLSFDLYGAKRVIAKQEAAAELQRQVTNLTATQQTSGELVHRLEKYAREEGIEL